MSMTTCNYEQQDVSADGHHCHLPRKAYATAFYMNVTLEGLMDRACKRI